MKTRFEVWVTEFDAEGRQHGFSRLECTAHAREVAVAFAAALEGPGLRAGIREFPEMLEAQS